MIKIKTIVKTLVISNKTRILSHLSNFTKCHEILKNTFLEKYFHLGNLNESLKCKSLSSFIIGKTLDDTGKTIEIFKCLSNFCDVTIPQKWHKEIKTKERFLTWMMPMAFYIFGSDSKDSKDSKTLPDVESKENTHDIKISNDFYCNNYKNFHCSFKTRASRFPSSYLHHTN